MPSKRSLKVGALAGTVVAALLMPSVGRAVGGRYAFAGGTPREQAEVVRALDASSFDWQVVPARITIHIEHGVPSQATKGEIWLDADLLDAGSFAWGVVQHEYAHQVDFFLLTASARAELLRELGGKTWCADATIRRDQLGCERFASMLAWAYWPSRSNCMRPLAGGSSATAFRALLSRLLPAVTAARSGVRV
jgi:hypothetical protein